MYVVPSYTHSGLVLLCVQVFRLRNRNLLYRKWNPIFSLECHESGKWFMRGWSLISKLEGKLLQNRIGNYAMNLFYLKTANERCC